MYLLYQTARSYLIVNIVLAYEPLPIPGNRRQSEKIADLGLYVIANSTYAIRQIAGKDLSSFFWTFCAYNYMILRDLIRMLVYSVQYEQIPSIRGIFLCATRVRRKNSITHHFGSLSMHGPSDLGSRHMSLAVVPLFSQLLRHSSEVRQLFWLPLQPPYVNVSHFCVSPLQPHLLMRRSKVIRTTGHVSRLPLLSLGHSGAFKLAKSSKHCRNLMGQSTNQTMPQSTHKALQVRMPTRLLAFMCQPEINQILQ